MRGINKSKMGLLHKIKHKAHHAVHNPPAIHIQAPPYHPPPVHIPAPPVHIPTPIRIPDPQPLPKIVIPKIVVPSIPKLPLISDLPKMVTAIKLPKMPDLGGGSNHKSKSTGGSKQKPGLSEGEIIAVAAVAAVVGFGIFFYV